MTRLSMLRGLAAGVLLFVACDRSEERLEAVYTSSGNLVGKNTPSMFDQSIQQGGYALLAGTGSNISVARKNALSSYVAWHVAARDATSGVEVDQIKAIATLAGASTNPVGASILVSSGHNRRPAIAVMGDRLFVIWECNSGVCFSSSADGQHWTTAVGHQLPSGRAVALDLTEHNGRLHAAGVVHVGATTRLFAAQVSVNSAGNDFALTGVNDDVVPGDHPSEAESVALASDGTHLWLGYVRDNTSRLTSFSSGAWSLSSSLIHEFSAGAASRPALAVVRNWLYACYRNGSLLSVQRRLLTANQWEAGNFHVNDAQANAAAGIDCHKITVIVN